MSTERSAADDGSKFTQSDSGATAIIQKVRSLLLLHISFDVPRIYPWPAFFRGT